MHILLPAEGRKSVSYRIILCASVLISRESTRQLVAHHNGKEMGFGYLSLSVSKVLLLRNFSRHISAVVSKNNVRRIVDTYIREDSQTCALGSQNLVVSGLEKHIYIKCQIFLDRIQRRTSCYAMR